MNSEQLFSQALGLPEPWQVQKVEFLSPVGAGNELHLFIDFHRGSRFANEAGAPCPVHDTIPRRWQHLSFFQHTCYLHCSLPRITDSDGKVTTVIPPWARSGSGFSCCLKH